MSKNLLILSVVILVIVLGGGAFLLYSKNYSAPTPAAVQEQAPTQSVSENPTSTPAEEQGMTNEKTEISLTSSGFSPKEITIKKGTTVVWTNNSGKVATVNSAPHPTHTNYPPLNLGNFDDGQSLELKFNEAGTYGYHNHLNASQNGSITVE